MPSREPMPPRYPETVFLLGDALRVVVAGRDSALAAHIVERLDLGAIAALQPEILPTSRREGEPFVGGFDEGDGTLQIVGREGRALRLRPPRGLFVTVPPHGSRVRRV